MRKFPMPIETLNTAIDLRSFGSLGKADHGWLHANHHFSFGGYHDAKRMGWGHIRVWNDDEIDAQSGFPPHSHDNMEIITYVREGAITHRDSMGNVGRTVAGDIQVMSAGTGVTHSEYNVEDSICRLFQIWILPRERGIAPRWDARQFPISGQSGGLVILASGYGEEGALAINADARVLGISLSAGHHIEHALEARDSAYLVITRGEAVIDGVTIRERDGLAIAAGANVRISATTDTELVLVESRSSGIGN
jgi:redox-sensitive bicupin YhaK (pirin superfamily)